MKFELSASLAGPGVNETMLEIVDTPEILQLGAPDWIRSDGERRDVTNWRTHVSNTKLDSLVMWEKIGAQVSYTPKSEVVTFVLPNDFQRILGAMTTIERMRFSLCELGTVFFKEWSAARYPTWGFGRSMIDHGWGCAFRGAGHDRLVSRRWLDFGPWRVIRRPNDTTFIQFHDLDLSDPAAAYAQAAPGHQRMGNDAIGGYLQHQLDWIIGDVKGLYLAETCLLEIVVGPHNTVDQEDMLSMCAHRLKHRLTPPGTGLVRDIAYIFINRADAEAHLHELWLRELQCWYVDGAGKHRLDDTYHPTPNPPEWVKRLNQLDAAK